MFMEGGGIGMTFVVIGIGYMMRLAGFNGFLKSGYSLFFGQPKILFREVIRRETGNRLADISYTGHDPMIAQIVLIRVNFIMHDYR